jgi:hypothetical protein
LVRIKRFIILRGRAAGMTAPESSRFLIKFREAAAPKALHFSARLGMARTTVLFASEPFFHSVGATPGRGGAAGGVWWLATASAKLDDGRPWDHRHAILAQNDRVALVKPDPEQQRTYRGRLPSAVDLSRRC